MKNYVIIPHHIFTNELVKLATRTIQSFRNTSDAIIVSVNDDSPMDTFFLQELSDVYIRRERGGFAKTCNAGFRWVQEHIEDDCYIVCANNDIEVYPEWFSRFKEALEKGKGSMVGGLGYKEKTIEGKPIQEFMRYDNFISEGGRIDDWLMPGGFWMTTKRDLEEVGLFDENFVNGYEDVDLFLRFKGKNKKLIMTPKVSYWHKEGATRFEKEERGKQKEDEIKNFWYFMNKWQFKQGQNILQFLTDNRIEL